MHLLFIELKTHCHDHLSYIFFLHHTHIVLSWTPKLKRSVFGEVQLASGRGPIETCGLTFSMSSSILRLRFSAWPDRDSMRLLDNDV